MAQHDLTDLVARIEAVGGTRDQLLALHDVAERSGTGEVFAWNRGAEAAAGRYVAGLEAAAHRRAAAQEVDAKVATGKVIFTKHRGEWVIVGPAERMTPGAVVEVSRAGGDTKTVQVLDVIGSNTRGVLATFSNVLPAPNPPARMADTGSGTCVECGRYHRHLRVVADSSGIPGLCCPRCAALDPVERSFA